MLLIATLAIRPCLIATIRVSSKFGVLGERFYIQRKCLQILKTLKKENNAVREFLRYEERGINATCFTFRIQCLLMCISLATIYCINPGSLYFAQPLFQVWSCVWHKSRFLELSIGKTLAWALECRLVPQIIGNVPRFKLQSHICFNI